MKYKILVEKKETYEVEVEADDEIQAYTKAEFHGKGHYKMIKPTKVEIISKIKK